MKIKLPLILSIFLLIHSELRAQQLPQFSQYLFNPIYINPAYTGYKGDTYIQTYVRKQWLGLEGSPSNYGIAMDGLLSNKNIGIGIHTGAQTIGFQRDYTFQTKLSYHLQLNKTSHLSMGSSFGFGNQKINVDKMDPIQANDPILENYTNSVFYPELSFGLFYYNPKFFISTSINNLFIDENSFSNTSFFIDSKKSATISAGLIFELINEKILEVSFLILSDNRSAGRFDLNINLNINQVIEFGIGSRNYTNAFRFVDQSSSLTFIEMVFLTQVNLNNNLGMGYSFDYSLKNSLNSHEFSLSYTINNRNLKIQSPRYF
jgi:type IX secretion system PorP/SprF family membrane protein